MVRRCLAVLVLVFCISVLIPSPAEALMLEMQIQVAPEDEGRLTASMDAIHGFFEDQSGFIRASLAPSGDSKFHLEEEWQTLEDYENAVNQADFKALAEAVPGSSNWTARSLLP